MTLHREGGGFASSNAPAALPIQKPPSPRSCERKEAVAALREHASKTARVAKGALKDRPQLREKLGLLERS